MSAGAAWLGPVIVATITSTFVTGLGWFMSERLAFRPDLARRRTRILNMQTALLAEIRASRQRQEDLSGHGSMVDAMMAQRENYVPFVPRQIPPAIFSSVMADIHDLPTGVIDPVVVYYRQRAVLTNLVEDLRSDRYDRLDQARRRLLYGDFVRLMQEADALGLAAEAALCRSLNMTGGGSSGRLSGAGRGAASGQDQAPRSSP